MNLTPTDFLLQLVAFLVLKQIKPEAPRTTSKLARAVTKGWFFIRQPFVGAIGGPAWVFVNHLKDTMIPTTRKLEGKT